MKILISLLSVLLFTNITFAECSDDVADSLVEKKVLEIAKLYNAKKIGISHSLLMGNIRSTNIIIKDGDGGTSGPVDRIGSVQIDIEKCRYKSYLVGVYSEVEVNN
ncbi:hypothetical protein CIK05_06895 [Bdellovibrio sp. qaytius]|nr:hypothetical protein CIK05_06895 [Bdellovibrio sp. qaytius]